MQGKETRNVLDVRGKIVGDVDVYILSSMIAFSTSLLSPRSLLARHPPITVQPSSTHNGKADQSHH